MLKFHFACRVDFVKQRIRTRCTYWQQTAVSCSLTPDGAEAAVDPVYTEQGKKKK